VNIQKNRDFHMKRWKLWIKKNKGYLKLSELKSSLLWINPSWYQNPLSGNG
jgi:ribosomal protein L11 methylase PrmA